MYQKHAAVTKSLAARIAIFSLRPKRDGRGALKALVTLAPIDFVSGSQLQPLKSRDRGNDLSRLIVQTLIRVMAEVTLKFKARA
jgi:hypothetical protein